MVPHCVPQRLNFLAMLRQVLFMASFIQNNNAALVAAFLVVHIRQEHIKATA